MAPELLVTDPLDVALRARMKGDFINAYGNALRDFSGWPDAIPVIFGSTVIQQLGTGYNTIFPVDKLKSEDVDIGVFETGRRNSPDFENKIRTHLGPVLKKAASASGLSLAPRKPGRSTISNGEIAMISNEDFGKEFKLQKTYTPQEIESVLRNHPYYAQLKPLIGPEPRTVTLEISTNRIPFPILMPPLKVKTDDHQNDIYIIHPLDMLASKLRRIMHSDYKITDILDIYNLIEGTRGNGAPLVDLNPNSPGNDLDTIRVLITSHLPFQPGFNPYGRQFFYNLEQAKNHRFFLEKLKPAVSRTALEVIDDRRQKDMVETTLGTLRRIMSPRGNTSYGMLNFSENEMQFLEGIQGSRYERNANGQQHAAPVVGMFARFGRKKVSTKTPHTDEAHIDVDALRREFPHVFSRYPELSDNLAGSATLQRETERASRLAQTVAADADMGAGLF